MPHLASIVWDSFALKEKLCYIDASIFGCYMQWSESFLQKGKTENGFVQLDNSEAVS